MYDLIYADKKAERIVRDKYPKAIIEDACDEIHLDRFSVTIGSPNDKATDEYLLFLLKVGLYEVSFIFRMLITDKKGRKKIEKIIEKNKTEEHREVLGK